MTGIELFQGGHINYVYENLRVVVVVYRNLRVNTSYDYNMIRVIFLLLYLGDGLPSLLRF